MPSDRSWWMQTWYCEYCAVEIRKHHRSRHLQSKGHLARLNALSSYQVMGSDMAFTRFLQTFDPRDFAGYELERFRVFTKMRRLGVWSQSWQENDALRNVR